MARLLRGRLASTTMLVCLAVFVATAARAEDPARAAFRKLPYLTFDGDAAAMQVHWQLQVTAPCTLDWGTDATYSLGSTVTAEIEPTHQHEARIADLDPSALYVYRVRSGSVSTGSFQTAPAADALAVKLLVYGDTRTYPATHDTVADGIVATYTADPAYQTIALMTGDLVADGNSEASWDTDFFAPARANIAELHANVPVASARGNHEGTAVLFAEYLPSPWVYGRAWSFDYGPVHVAVLDQYTSYSAGSPQLEWLENDLASTDKPWKIVALHEPGWSAGGGHANSAAVQTLIQPLCVEYGVQTVVGGHNHYYAHAAVDGVHHVTAGGGGAPLHTPNPTYPYVVATAKAHHFCTIAIDEGALVLTAVGKAGQVLDTFSITHAGVPGDTGAAGDPGATAVPAALSLATPAPNPSTGGTALSLTLVEPAHVTLSIHDASGRCVRSLVDRTLARGIHEVPWDGRDDAGRPVPSGVYFARAEAAGSEVTQKIIALR